MRWPWRRGRPDGPDPGTTSDDGPPDAGRSGGDRGRPLPHPGSGAGAGASDGGGVGAVGPAGWAHLPPVQRSLGPMPLTAGLDTARFALAAWGDPSATGPLTHLVTDAAASGVIDGDGAGTGTPAVGDPGGDLPLALPAPPAPDATGRARRPGSALVSARAEGLPVLRVQTLPADTLGPPTDAADGHPPVPADDAATGARSRADLLGAGPRATSAEGRRPPAPASRPGDDRPAAGPLAPPARGSVQRAPAPPRDPVAQGGPAAPAGSASPETPGLPTTSTPPTERSTERAATVAEASPADGATVVPLPPPPSSTGDVVQRATGRAASGAPGTTRRLGLGAPLPAVPPRAPTPPAPNAPTEARTASTAGDAGPPGPAAPQATSDPEPGPLPPEPVGGPPNGPVRAQETATLQRVASALPEAIGAPSRTAASSVQGRDGTLPLPGPTVARSVDAAPGTGTAWTAADVTSRRAPDTPVQPPADPGSTHSAPADADLRTLPLDPARPDPTTSDPAASDPPPTVPSSSGTLTSSPMPLSTSGASPSAPPVSDQRGVASPPLLTVARTTVGHGTTTPGSSTPGTNAVSQSVPGTLPLTLDTGSATRGEATAVDGLTTGLLPPGPPAGRPVTDPDVSTAPATALTTWSSTAAGGPSVSRAQGAAPLVQRTVGTGTAPTLLTGADRRPGAGRGDGPTTHVALTGPPTHGSTPGHAAAPPRVPGQATALLQRPGTTRPPQAPAPGQHDVASPWSSPDAGPGGPVVQGAWTTAARPGAPATGPRLAGTRTARSAPVPVPEADPAEAPAPQVAADTGDEPAPAVVPDGPRPDDSPSPAQGFAATAEQLDDLARRLVGPLTRRLRADLLIDRERHGRRTDAR